MRWSLLVVGLTASATASAEPNPGYQVRLAERVDVTVGAASPLSVAVAPNQGLTISRDAPMRIAIAPSPGLDVNKRRLSRSDAADPAADSPRFELNLRAAEPGDHAVAIDLAFWLCGRAVCRPIRVTRSVEVAARPVQ
jgi:hypothetical protein